MLRTTTKNIWLKFGYWPKVDNLWYLKVLTIFMFLGFRRCRRSIRIMGFNKRVVSCMAYTMFPTFCCKPGVYSALCNSRSTLQGETSLLFFVKVTTWQHF